MASLNVVALVGNLTRDPELRHTPDGIPVCKLRLAVNTRTKGADGNWGDKPNYFDVVVWRGQAESAAQYLAKGSRIGVNGRLDWREWTAQDGTKRQAVEIVAENVQFLTSRRDEGDGYYSSQEGDFSPAAEPSAQEPSAGGPSRDPDFVPSPGQDFGDDDIPF